MDINSLIVIFFSFAVALFCSWYLLTPIFSVNKVVTSQDKLNQQKTELLIKKKNLETLLEDLSNEFSNAQIAEQDYQKSKGELELQLIKIEKDLTSIANESPEKIETLASNG